MSKLYLVRHGIAVERGTPGVRDEDRPLTAKGERRIRQVARGLAALGAAVDRIVTSPLPRAKRTAELLAEELTFPDPLEIDSVLHADSDAHDVAEWLKIQPAAPLMIVGHSPILDELLSLLLLGDAVSVPFELKKGGAALLQRPLPDGESYSLDWLATPKLLRTIAR